MEERRSSLRYELLAQTRVKRGTVSHIMDVKNISLTGVFIATTDVHQTRTFRVDQVLELDIFSTEDLENIRVFGRIVRIQKTGDEYGFGIHFEEMTDETRTKIAKLVQLAFKLSGKPPMLPCQLAE